jgi:ribosomal protein S18 acetylase RimI-like enzyme
MQWCPLRLMPSAGFVHGLLVLWPSPRAQRWPECIGPARLLGHGESSLGVTASVLAVSLTIGRAGPEDAEALARLWLEGARELIDMAPERFRLPESHGLVEFLRSDLEHQAPDALSLVAELDGEVVASLEARLLAPVESARFQVLEDLGRLRVYVDHLRVDQPFRRRGVATQLMAEAERWGRQHGASSIALDTYAESPLSLGFYRAAGYQRTSIVFEKRLD